MHRQTQQEDPKNEILEAMRMTDKQKKGYILASELRAKLTGLGEKLTDREGGCSSHGCFQYRILTLRQHASLHLVFTQLWITGHISSAPSTVSLVWYFRYCRLPLISSRVPVPNVPNGWGTSLVFCVIYSSFQYSTIDSDWPATFTWTVTSIGMQLLH